MATRLFAATGLLMLSTAGLAQSPAPLNPAAANPGPLQRDEIVVVGAKLADLKAAMERCEAGGCTVREDVIATVRYAEAQFRNGQYHDARKVLGRSVSRTRTAADSDPFAVAELQTARATVAWHYGDQREALRATAKASRLLGDHAPQSANALMARMRMIAAQAHNFGTLHTMDRLRFLADDARAAGQPLVAMRADLGRANMLYRLRREKEALSVLDSVVANAAPNGDGLRKAAQILRLRLTVKDGGSDAVEALIASLGDDLKRGGPVLLWAPRMPEPDGAPAMESIAPRTGDRRSGGGTPLRWVDIGFTVEPDGRVSDVEVLRGSPRAVWAAPLLKTIAQRRYTPAADPGDMQGRQRVERYTLTADFIIPGQSLIRQRGGRTRFEQMDLTVAAPPESAPSPSVPS